MAETKIVPTENGPLEVTKPTKGDTCVDYTRQSLTRSEAIKRLVVLPALAGALAAGSVAVAQADNKKQFKYQNKPGKHGQKCSGCSLFRPPNGCKVVTGRISPNGWCIAWAAKH